MMCTPEHNMIEDVLSEAAHRIRAAIAMIDRSQDREQSRKPAFGGYDVIIARETLEDVAAVLTRAVTASPTANLPAKRAAETAKAQ